MSDYTIMTISPIKLVLAIAQAFGLGFLVGLKVVQLIYSAKKANHEPHV
jgi:hypothetical protein